MKDELIELFYANRNEEKAAGMAAYMKNQFPFLGLSKPERAALAKPFLRQAKNWPVDWGFVDRLWALPEREFQYLAVDYLCALADKLQPEDIAGIGGLVSEKPWWDTVDALATNVTGVLCAKYPAVIDSDILRWAAGENIWLARVAILFQLKYKDRTDSRLLARIIGLTCGTREFFLNKAIGWALREYSKTDREWVRDFIAGHRLHPLSVREGSKYVDKSGYIGLQGFVHG